MSRAASLNLGTRDAAKTRILHPSIRNPPFASMSSADTTSKSEDAVKPTEPLKEGDQGQVPHLSVLEEDDEFEEFAVQGEHATTALRGNARFERLLAETPPTSLDWDDSQTDLAHLGGVAPGAAKSEGDKLWEDNWDDDDIEEEFSVQLR